MLRMQSPYRGPRSTELQELGVEPVVIDATQGHKVRSSAVSGINQRHTYGPERREALLRWARRLEQIVSGEKAELVQFGSA